MSTEVAPRPWHRQLLTPTLNKQCWGFVIGASLFAIGSAPGFGSWAGASTANLFFFTGAWFFTAAGLVQLLLSGAATVAVDYGSGTMVRAEWLAASTQSAGTVMFNVSTASALVARAVTTEDHFVWFPDAAGSVAFLVSGLAAIIAYAHTDRWWNPRSVDWWSTQINWIGCVAFGVSAVGAFVLADGNTVDNDLATAGTFIGALCFMLASLIVAPTWRRRTT